MNKFNVTTVFNANLKAYNEGYRTIVNKGSSRSSKTYSIMQTLDCIARYKKKSIIISVVSQTFPHLKSGPIRDYINFLKSMGWYNDKIHHQTDHYFKIGNSIIEYFSADNVDKVHGPARDILFINEPNKGISFDIYNQLSIRTEESLFIDYNPSGEFYLQKEGILDEVDCILIKSTWRDNLKNLSPQQINEFHKNQEKAKDSKYWGYWWKVYGEGEDAVLLEERIMPFIDYVDKIPEDAVQIPSGLDFGFNPDPTAFGNLWLKENENDFDDLYIQEVVYQTRLSINSKSPGSLNLLELLESSGHDKEHLIISESAEPRNVTEIRNEGYNIVAVKKKKIETSIKLFHDYKIHFLRGSDNFYNEFDNYKYKVNKDGEILGVPADRQADHGIDLCRYVILSKGRRW